MNESKTTTPAAVDESAESEITIQPDGRVFAFGITGPLASVLLALPMADGRMMTLLRRIAALNQDVNKPTGPQPLETE